MNPAVRVEEELTKIQVIDRQIEGLKSEKEDLLKQKDSMLAIEAMNYMVKTLCLTCMGSGQIERGGKDILSDPPYQDQCDQCLGEKYRYCIPYLVPIPHHLKDKCMELAGEGIR